MNHKISLLLPTRGRPYLLKRLFQSIVDHTTDLDNLEVILYMDDDDTNSHCIDDHRLNIVKVIGPRSSMGVYNTICLDHSSGEIIMLMNDDLTICTPGWDQIIINLFSSISDGIFMAYPKDTDAGRMMSTFPIMSRKTCDILLRPYPKEYDSLFIDAHIFDIFIRLKYLGEDRIHYLRKILFDHHHFVNGKVRPDADYSNKNRYKDGMIFISLRQLRQVSAQRLYLSIEGQPLPDLPNPLFMEKSPANLFHAIRFYFSVFLTDFGLPMNQRVQLFIKFSKYYAAMKGGLTFLKRKSYTLYGN